MRFCVRKLIYKYNFYELIAKGFVLFFRLSSPVSYKFRMFRLGYPNVTPGTRNYCPRNWIRYWKCHTALSCCLSLSFVWICVRARRRPSPFIYFLCVRCFIRVISTACHKITHRNTTHWVVEAGLSWREEKCTSPDLCISFPLRVSVNVEQCLSNDTTHITVDMPLLCLPVELLIYTTHRYIIMNDG